MKQSLTLLAAALMLSGVSTSFAASSVDLSVKGMITPSACVPTLSGGGVVDYGKISAQDLKPNGFTPLPEGRLELSVACEAATLMAVKSTDNRPGTSAESGAFLKNFGLGLASGDKKIGWYLLKMANATGDGVPRAIIESEDGNSWIDAWDTIWQVGWMRTLNGASGGAATPLPLQNLKVDVIVAPTLADKRSLPITEEILLDGSATFDVVYL